MMETRMSFPVPRVAGFSPLLMNPARSSAAHRFAVSLAVFVAFGAASAIVAAQQPYASSPYGAYGSPYGNSYAQPAAPQYGYGQPQYQQPPYGYAQPQYSAPQQPYTQQPYAQQPYSQEQPYASSPYAQQQEVAPDASGTAQALSADQLEQMLAPIALYPDSLLAQILAASTYPAQVAIADQWLHQMQSQGYGSADQIAAGANQQTSWDPSVKALTAFPDVLDMLNHNLDWTTALGNAYYNQPQDVMQTVQVLRQRAEQAGNLQSTPQEDVSEDQGYIDVAPPNPEQVYVPTYNPWQVYGQPISPYPGFSFLGALGDFFGSSPIQYALSFGLGAFERFPFGWLGWGLDWLANDVLFNHGSYYTHSASVADWGLPHGGPRAYGWHGGYDHGGFNRGYGAQRAFEQRGSEQRGFDQRGTWGGNRDQGDRGSGQSYLRPSVGTPYNPHSLAFNNGAGGYNRGSSEFNRGGYQNGYGATHPEIPARQMYGNYNRAETQPGYSYRPQAYPNHGQTYASRPQSFSNPGYGYANRGTQQAYAARPGYSYASPYRAPQSYTQPYSSHGSTSRSYGGYGNSFAGGQQRSGGFHLFGHSSEPRGFSGSERAPKYSYKAPKGFGGGGHSSHSFGGGHSSSHSFSGGHGSSHPSGGHHH